MHWPPWRPDPADVEARRRAEKELRETCEAWPEVRAVAEATDRNFERNHFLQKALVLKGRGDS